MNEYQIRFLKQQVLGQKVKMNDPVWVIKRCVELADTDMLSGGRFVYDFFKKKDRKDRVDYIIKELEDNNYMYNKIDKKKICKSLLWECDKTQKIIVRGKERYYKPYGLSQKLVNMTFKYLL